MQVQVQYIPDPPTTIPFDDTRFKKGSKDLPIDKPPLAKVTGEDEPEQIHIALAGQLALALTCLLSYSYAWKHHARLHASFCCCRR